MTAERFEFFFDVHSPYSYLAATQLPALEKRVGVRATWVPVLLGGIFKETGNRSPASLPAKARYTWLDVHRYALRYGVPVHFPSWFPGNSLAPMRMLTAAFEGDEGTGRRLTMACFQAAWVDNVDMSLPEALVEVANMAGLPGRELAALAREQRIKDKLRTQTDAAVRRGMFGVPTFFVGDELYWGNDRMNFVEDALNEYVIMGSEK